MRAFFALEPDDDARARLVAVMAEGRLRPDLARASWTKPENLHLTLRFLGEVDGAVVETLAARLPEACRGLTRPHARFSCLSGFPLPGASRSLFADVADEEGVLAAAAAVQAMVHAVKLPRDERAFHPHVTVARCRPALDVGPWSRALRAPLGPVQFPRCTLFESRGGPGGSVYVPRATVTLPPLAYAVT